MKLTERQHEMIRHIARYQRLHQGGPTIRWLMRAMAIASPNGVMTHIRLLRKKGCIVPQQKCGEARGVVLADAGWRAVGMMPTEQVEDALRRYRIERATPELARIIDQHFDALVFLMDRVPNGLVAS